MPYIVREVSEMARNLASCLISEKTNKKNKKKSLPAQGFVAVDIFTEDLINAEYGQLNVSKKLTNK